MAVDWDHARGVGGYVALFVLLALLIAAEAWCANYRFNECRRIGGSILYCLGR